MSEDAAAPERQPMGCIDAHVHVWTADVARYPLAPGYSANQMNPRSFTPEELLAHARPAGVDRIVLIQMVFYGYDNSYMLDCIRLHPGVFSGVALVDEQGTDPAAEMRRLEAKGIRGVRISPAARGASDWLDGLGMQSMWTAAAEQRMAMCPLIDPEDLPAVDRMCRRFADTPVVVDHCARIGGGGEFCEADIAKLCGLARHPQVYVKLSAFYFFGTKRPPYTECLPMIRRLIDVFGCQRLMWATDSPFQVQPPHSYRASLELIRDRLDGLSATDHEWLLKHTAETLFFV